MNRRRDQPALSQPSITLAVRLIPRASRSCIRGWMDDRLQVAVSAPPVDGAANSALCALLAEATGVRAAQVAVISGHRSREKVVRIEGLDADRLNEVLPPRTTGRAG